MHLQGGISHIAGGLLKSPLEQHCIQLVYITNTLTSMHNLLIQYWVPLVGWITQHSSQVLHDTLTPPPFSQILQVTFLLYDYNIIYMFSPIPVTLPNNVYVFDSRTLTFFTLSLLSHVTVSQFFTIISLQ